jgi:hypothetical protein
MESCPPLTKLGHITSKTHFKAGKEIDSALDALERLRAATKRRPLPKTIRTRQEAVSLYEAINDLTDSNGEPLFSPDKVPSLSVALFFLYPASFFPYYFYPNFHLLKKIFEEFSIFLPPVPKKRDLGDRFRYYSELCESLRDFCDTVEMTPEHLPVFLYGFAPEVCPLPFQKLTELPKPQRAWFVGGGIHNNGDYEFLKNANSSSRTFWQGNKDTEAGDIMGSSQKIGPFETSQNAG